jgi:hypothetical protein
VLFDMSSNFFTFASDLSNADFVVFADFSSESSAMFFLGEFMLQAFMLAVLERDGSAEAFFFSFSTFLDCLCSAGTVGQEFLQMMVLFSKVLLGSFNDFSYAFALRVSRFFCTDNCSNLLAVLVDETFVRSNSLFPFTMFLHASIDDYFLAFFLSFKGGSAGFRSEFLASMRNSSNLVFTKASSESLLCFLLGFRAMTSSMFTSVSSNIFAYMMDSSCIAFLKTFFLDLVLAILVLSTFESSFG